MRPIELPSLHGMDCHCSKCSPAPSPADQHLSLNDMILIGILGLIVGFLIVGIWDHLSGGPGVIPELGL